MDFHTLRPTISWKRGKIGKSPKLSPDAIQYTLVVVAFQSVLIFHRDNFRYKNEVFNVVIHSMDQEAVLANKSRFESRSFCSTRFRIPGRSFRSVRL